MRDSEPPVRVASFTHALAMIGWIRKPRRNALVLPDALAGAEAQSASPALIVAYRTILGLASLYRGVCLGPEHRDYQKTMRLAREYWEPALHQGRLHQLLTGYLHDQIAGWLACAEFNSVEQTVADDESVRERFNQRLGELGALVAFERMHKALPTYAGAQFNIAYFATSLREYEKAAVAYQRIEQMAPANVGDHDFAERYRHFRRSPLIEREWPKIEQALRAIEAPARRMKKSKRRR